MAIADKYVADSPVSICDKQWNIADYFALWMSLGIGLAVLQTGGLLTPHLNLMDALWVIAGGSLLGAGLLALVGAVSQHYGLSTMAILSHILGRRGVTIAAVMNVVQLIGWGTFEIVLMRNALLQLIHQWFPEALWLNSPLLWTLILGALATWQAVLGPLTWVRILLRRVGIWVVLAGCVTLTYYWFTHYSWAQLAAQPGEGGLSIALGIDIVLSMAISWLPLVGDFSRFGHRSGSTFQGTALGYWLGTTWIMGLGAAYQLILPPGASSVQLTLSLAMAFAGWPLLLILLDETENAFAPIHSAGVSANLITHINPAYLMIGCGLFVTGLAYCIDPDVYIHFLLWIGSIFTPLFALLLVDALRWRSASSLGQDSRYSALAAWAIGAVIYHLLLAYWPTLGASLPTLVLTAVIYRLLKGVRVFSGRYLSNS